MHSTADGHTVRTIAHTYQKLRQPGVAYVGVPKSYRKHFLVGGPVVVHASAARCLLQGPFCISLPTGIVV
jgi:hypothetical protein